MIAKLRSQTVKQASCFGHCGPCDALGKESCSARLKALIKIRCSCHQKRICAFIALSSKGTRERADAGKSFTLTIQDGMSEVDFTRILNGSPGSGTDRFH